HFLFLDIPVEAELFPTISCLFSDIVGFTALCGRVSPMDIIRMLNKLYILFDALTGVYEVYKVCNFFLLKLNVYCDAFFAPEAGALVKAEQNSVGCQCLQIVLHM